MRTQVNFCEYTAECYCSACRGRSQALTQTQREEVNRTGSADQRGLEQNLGSDVSTSMIQVLAPESPPPPAPVHTHTQSCLFGVSDVDV